MYVCMYWRIPPPRNFCNQERKLSQYHAICTAIAKKTKIGELGAVIIIVYYIVLSFQYQTPLCTHCVSIFYLPKTPGVETHHCYFQMPVGIGKFQNHGLQFTAGDT